MMLSLRIKEVEVPNALSASDTTDENSGIAAILMGHPRTTVAMVDGHETPSVSTAQLYISRTWSV